MEKKKTLQHLVAALAARREIPKKQAELFVRTVFDIISQYLETDKLVKIKGLGTFKLIQVESRESVDVNTGQRILIKGYTKVAFIPDAALRDTVNKPFAQFETVVLNEGTDVSAMERIASPITPMPLQDDEGGAEDVVAESLEQEDVAATTLHAGPLTMPLTGSLGDEEEEDSAPDTVMVEPVVVEETPADEVTEQPADVEPAEEEPEPEEAPVAAEEEPVAAEEIPATAEEAPATAEEPVVVEVQSQHVEVQHVGHQTVETQHVVQVPPEWPKGTIHITRKAAVLSVILVACLMVLSYLAGYNHLLEWSMAPSRHEAPKDTVLHKEKAVTVPQDSVPHDTLPSPQPVQPEAQYPQLPDGTHLIVGTLTQHTLKSGESLRKLAIKYYGSKDFTDYIILYNQIKNPDVVPVGKVLEIPELRAKQP